jgi:hypothetical protein
MLRRPSRILGDGREQPAFVIARRLHERRRNAKRKRGRLIVIDQKVEGRALVLVVKHDPAERLRREPARETIERGNIGQWFGRYCRGYQPSVFEKEGSVNSIIPLVSVRARSNVFRAFWRSTTLSTRAMRSKAATRTVRSDRSACSSASARRSSGMNAVYRVASEGVEAVAREMWARLMKHQAEGSGSQRWSQ